MIEGQDSGQHLVSLRVMFVDVFRAVSEAAGWNEPATVAGPGP